MLRQTGCCGRCDDNSSWDYEFDGTREGIPEEYLLFVNEEDLIIFSEQEKETKYDAPQGVSKSGI